MNILNLFLVIFFPFSLLKLAATIFYGWNSFGGEFQANFPFYLFLKDYNLPLYDSLNNYSWGGPGFSKTWFYGPIHHLWLFPLTLFFHSMTPFYRLLLIFYICLFICCVVLIFNSIKKDNSVLFFIAYLTVVFGSFQLMENLRQRNVELLEFFLIGIAYLFLQRKRDFAGGALLCLAAMAKLFPFIFLPYLIIKKRFKAVVGFLITFIIIAIITQMTLRWQNWQLLNPDCAKDHGFPMVDTLLGRNCFQPVQHTACSLPTLVLMFFAKIDMSRYMPIITYRIDNFFIPNMIYLLLAILIAALTFYLFYRTGKKADLFQEFSLICLTMLLVSSHCNPHYYIFTIFAYISILKTYSYDLDKYELSLFSKIFMFGVYILSLFLMGNLIPFQLYEKLLPLKNIAFHYFVTYNLFVFGTVILWCIMMWIYYMNYRINR